MDFQTASEKKVFLAAREVFLKKGKDGARISEIAQKAEINSSMIFYYFRSKEALYEKVLLHELQSFVQDFLDSLSDSAEFSQFLKYFIDQYMDRLANRIAIARLLTWESVRDVQRIARTINSVFEERGYTRLPLLQKIEQAIAEKQIRPMEPLNFMLTLIGVCTYPLIARAVLKKIFPEMKITDNEFLKRRKEEVFDLIWRGIQPGSGE